MDNDVKNAVLELAGFYGMSAGDKYIQAIYNNGTVQSTSKALESANEAAVGSAASTFTEEAKSFTDLKTAVEEIKSKYSTTLAEVAKVICITPHNADSGLTKDEAFANAFSEKDGDQGKGKPAGDIFTMDDLREKDEKSDSITGLTPVHAIQIFPAKNTPASANTELSALWVNSIPAIEMSRAIPFFDMRLVIPGSVPSVGPKSMSLDRFLMGSFVDEKMKSYLNSHFLRDPSSAQIEGTEGSGLVTNEAVVGSMELFTSPQTMVSLTTGPRSGIAAGQNADPFRPLMSFTDMSISVVPSGGLMSFKTAKMNLILHDRTRLKEILSLVAPGKIGGTQLEVTYGWSHPNHNKLGRTTDASIDNRFAKLINAMRTTEVFNVQKTNYSFTESGEVEIEVDLALAGTGAIENIEITDPKVASKEETLSTMFAQISEILTRIRASAPGGKISYPKYVTSSTNLGGAALVQRKDAYKMRLAIQRLAGIKDPDYKELAKLLKGVYGAKGTTGKLKELRNSKTKILTDMIKFLKKSSDPFLPRRAIGNCTTRDMKVVSKGQIKAKNQSYVSFGKLVCTYVAEAIRHNDQYSEVQVVFYPINESASHAYTLNTAQFPILISDLETILKERFEVNHRMTIGAFLRIINGYFLRDQGSEVYGLDSLFGARTKGDDKKLRTKRKRNNSYKKGDKFAAKKLELLRKAYGLSKDSTGLSFRMPQVTLRYEVAPAKGKPESVKPILRVHVMDQGAGKAEQLKDAMMAFGGDGVFHQVERKSEAALKKKGVRIPDHGAGLLEHLTALTKSKIIKKASEESDLGLDDALKSELEGIYILNTKAEPAAAAAAGDNQTAAALSLNFKAKETFKSLFPSITYGNANSNMISANLETISDSSMNTVALLRQGKSDADRDIGQDNGLPMQIMPTQLSIETYGCPYVAFGQQFFVDFGTNTTADNFYAVVGLEHKIAQGEFTTEISLVQLDGFGTFRSALDSKRRLEIVAKIVEAAQKAKS